MNPYIYPILLDKTKIKFLQDIRPDVPSCKKILDFMCKHYKMSAYNLFKNQKSKYKRYFIYLCYKIHDSQYIELLRDEVKNRRKAKEGLCKSIKSLMFKRKQPDVINSLRNVINEIGIYRQVKEELLSLESKLFGWWHGK